MKIIRIVFRYAVKIIANLLKGLAYPLYALLPGLRFTIPGETAPLAAPRHERQIPRTVWLTNYTDRVTLPLILNYWFNRIMAPTYAFRFCSDEDIASFVRAEFDEQIQSAYFSLNVGAAKADFWRVLVLYRYGGVYMDVDAHLLWPLEFIVGPDNAELFLELPEGGLSNYFMASRPGTDNLSAVIDFLSNNIRTKSSDDVFELTGPTALDNALHDRRYETVARKYNCNQGNFTNKYFQYMDKKEGYWRTEQQKVPIVGNEIIRREAPYR